MGQHKFPRAQTQRTIRYIPTSKFIYFHWIAKSIVLVVGKSAKTMGQHIFLSAQAQYTIRYIPTTYTSTIDKNLDQINFANIFDLINTSVLTHEYGLQKYP